MKILLIGDSGQVGTLLKPAFGAHDVRGVHRPDIDLLDGASIERAVRENDPDAVVLAAGLANADLCEERPGDAYAVNVDGLRRVAEASRGRGFLSFSTDHVFDGRSGPYAEEDEPAPLSVYGRTKLEGERIALTVHPRALVVRTTLVFARGDRSFFSRLVTAVDPVPCWTDHFATYTYGPMLAEAATELLERGASGLWHVTGTDVLSRYEFALRVAARWGKDPALYRPVPFRQSPPRAPRPLRAGLRTDKAREFLRTKLLSTDEALTLIPR
ncbi:MAG TPA: SDR family oxidoreductase [Planctomycetota bacterium]|nr:SDR family oxidoreductase [Planctomycetota bacterium]